MAELRQSSKYRLKTRVRVLNLRPFLPSSCHPHDYSQVTDDALVVLTDDSTDTKHEKNVEKTHWREEAEQKERERKAKREEAR
ncbi:hypothetical protein M404DRAFT_24201 [Pisolithus tinctorius Marx 270]|uniref:Uncharacterized protein n=1 Tax=Pisolithus tinctorius Marx 270 TaxID=870435 RepID=A0A0C3JDE7_PISTI|nr:hypothetical protein M404DRAFT_24201 [Pisolithus tinctorius Marx 270]